jgi:23S rRNA pseudouridine1911/1915/1917 synthase
VPEGTVREEVPANLAGERLDRVVSMIADISRSAAAALISGGHVRLDGANVEGKQRLLPGQVVEIDLEAIPEPSGPLPDPTVELHVVHEDDDVIVIDKQAGLVVHPASGNETGTLVNGLLARYPEIAGVGEPDRPGIVHRLDSGTTGLLVVAHSQQGYDHLVDRLRRHLVERTYRALTWGHPASPNGMIDAPLGRDPRNPLKVAVVAGGRPARTRYETLEVLARPDLALLACRLETGRTHQIRVHLQAIGHPIVGDPLYAVRRPTLGLERPFLHATRLTFEHPRSGREMTFESPLADDLAAVLEAQRAAP